MELSIEEQIEHYTNQVAIYLSYEYSDEPTLKFFIKKLNKLINQMKEGVIKWKIF